MRRSKKIIVTFCVILAVSISLMVTCSAVEPAYTTYSIRGFGPLDIMGTVTQFSAGSNPADSKFIEAEVDYTNSDLIYGSDGWVTGFRWDNWSVFAGTGTNDGGIFTLTVPLLFQNFYPSDTYPYRVKYIDVSFNCFLYARGLGRKYPISNPSARIVDSYGNVFAEVDSFSDTMGWFDVEGSVDRVIDDQVKLYCEISWVGKPSAASNTYLEFELYSGSDIQAMPLNEFDSALQDGMNQSNKDMANKVDQALDKLDSPSPDIDSVISNPDIKDYVDSSKNLFSGEGDFYNFIASMMIVGVSIAVLGYALHGKREG